MQIGEAVQAALNAQVGHELDAAYRYLAMTAWCTEHRLPGCARWLRHQAEEELGHALKCFDFVHARDGAVLLTPLTAPPDEFADVRAVFAAALAHERRISALLHDLYTLAGGAGA